MAIFTQSTELIQHQYLESAPMSEVCYFVNTIQNGLTKPSKIGVMCQWNIPKGQRVDTTVQPVRDLFLEKFVYTKPKSKSVKSTKDKKESLGFFQL